MKRLSWTEIEENIMSNIIRFDLIDVTPYLGGTFKVFSGETYLVMDMKQHFYTCIAFQMFRLSCAHAYVVIHTMRQIVYKCVETCYKSPENLIYSDQF